MTEKDKELQELRQENEKLKKSVAVMSADLKELYGELENKSEELKAAYTEINRLKDRIAGLTSGDAAKGVT